MRTPKLISSVAGASLTWLALALVCGGCAATERANVRVIAPTSRVPVSLSSTLADAHGIVAPERMRVVGELRYEPTCAALSSLDDGTVSESKATVVNLSDALNEQVTRAGGNGVVRFTIETRRNGNCLETRFRGAIVSVDEAR